MKAGMLFAVVADDDKVFDGDVCVDVDIDVRGTPLLLLLLTIPSPPPPNPCLIPSKTSFNFFSNLSTSETFVAPSASINKTFCPRAHNTPALTAYPFPLFLGSRSTRTASLPYFLALSNAVETVPSLLPSSTTTTS